MKFEAFLVYFETRSELGEDLEIVMLEMPGEEQEVKFTKDMNMLGFPPPVIFIEIICDYECKLPLSLALALATLLYL